MTTELTVTTDDDGQPRMGMMAWLSTDGGTRCPQCGKFAKPDQLGPIGGPLVDDSGRSTGHVSVYNGAEITSTEVPRMPQPRTFETCASADSATPASEVARQVTSIGASAQQSLASPGATNGATACRDWRSADLGDRMDPIATRLPAGLTEAELLLGYDATALRLSVTRLRRKRVPFVAIAERLGLNVATVKAIASQAVAS